FDPAREMGDRRVGDVFVFCGKGTGIGDGLNKAILLRAAGLAGKNRGVVREWRDIGINFARTGAEFIESGHVGAPGGGGLREILRGEFDLNEFFGLGEGGGGDFGTDGGSGAEGGGSAGSALGWVL